MARLFNGASGEYLIGDAPVREPPFAWSCMFNTSADVGATSGKVLSLLDGTTTNQYYRLGIKSGVLNTRVRSAGSFTDLPTTTAPVTGAWHNACAVYRSTSDRSVFLDGGGRGDNTTTISPSAPTVMQIGANTDSGDYFTGGVAEIAVWKPGLLSPAEVDALGRRYSPLWIRSHELVFYMIAWADEDFDIVGGQTFAIGNGAPSTRAHPSMIYPPGFAARSAGRSVIDPVALTQRRRRYFFALPPAGGPSTRRIMIDDALIVVSA